ncbi:UNVERIFIED_CONTAM: hypothetical protein GTU68_063416, partial [Idotea baltica]|nr:hypothetical protein [Idotea baltica]
TFLLPVFGQSCDPEYNEYFADSKQCDRYVECLDGGAYDKLCPAGLLFNELTAPGAFPCSYPSEVECGARSIIQPAQPSENCGNSWGYFGTGNSAVCDIFYNCVDGVSFRFNCPEGLAFSSSSYRCEWPEESPDCDASGIYPFSIAYSMYVWPYECAAYV